MFVNPIGLLLFFFCAFVTTLVAVFLGQPAVWIAVVVWAIIFAWQMID